jgi:hypothetical protein
MKTRLIITDLTRMYHQNVCIAGYTKSHQCIRPVSTSGGIPESALFRDHKAILYPFAEIELDLLKPKNHPPHTEDWSFNPWSLRFIGEIGLREQVLERSLHDSVQSIFGQEILTDPGYYALDCQGPRSLGTLIPTKILALRYEPGVEGNWDYRLAFTDQTGTTYRLKIVDLTWQYYCASLRDEETTPKEIASQTSKNLENRKVYLRIGLARGWKKYPERCYLQITGIYTFPDYLGGKNFSHFSRKEASEFHG